VILGNTFKIKIQDLQEHYLLMNYLQIMLLQGGTGRQNYY